jgi:hypothetical protein
MNTLSLKESNDKIIELLQSNKPFYISRMGIGAETYIPYIYKTTNNIQHNDIKKLLYMLDNNNGIYNLNLDSLKKYCNLYYNSIKNSDYLASFINYIINEQKFMKPDNKELLYSRILEPFYCCLEDIKPWSHYLLGKRVLIISPFVESFKKQLENKFQIFKDPNKKIFLDNQEFIFYKTFITTAGNHIHKNWEETFDIMCDNISKLDFDIALVSCGGYGAPLSYYIKKQLNKTVIYVGGGLQLLFGVMGKRWENNDMWKKIIKENESNFIRPSGDEIINNINRVENGCFW